MPGARYTKSFNTLTSAFQAQAAARPPDQRGAADSRHAEL